MSAKVDRLKEFERDMKQLRKKYKTIDDDIAVVEHVLAVEPSARPPFSFNIDNLGLETCVIKVRKVASRSFKGRGAMSGFRLVYAHFESEGRIVLIEVYHKSIKETEDKLRIKEHFR